MSAFKVDRTVEVNRLKTQEMGQIHADDLKMVSFFKSMFQHFVTLGTPRGKAEDLEEFKDGIDESKYRKIHKSVTFDLRNFEQNEPKEEESKSEEFNQDSIIDKERQVKMEGLEIVNKYFAEEDIVEVPKAVLWRRVLDYFRCSSLFIFHKDLKFRKFLIDLVISPETLLEYRNKKKEDAMFVSLPNEPNISIKKKVSILNKLYQEKGIKSLMSKEPINLDTNNVIDFSIVNVQTPLKKTKTNTLGKSRDDLFLE